MNNIDVNVKLDEADKATLDKILEVVSCIYLAITTQPSKDGDKDIQITTADTLLEKNTAPNVTFNMGAAAPVSAATQQIPVTPTTQAPINPAPAPVVPTAPAHQPAPAAVPTSAPTYTLEMLARAGTALIDVGKMDALCELLAKYQVEALTALDPAQYGALANDLRALGAQL